MRDEGQSPNVMLPWFIVLLLLFMGAFFYYFFRAGNIFFSTLGLSQPIFQLPWFFNALPSFVHIYVMSILTWLSFNRTKKRRSIMIWLWLNLIFEVSQTIHEAALPLMPSILKAYFINGTFSWVDIVAIFLGAFASYFTLNYFERREQHA